MDILFAKELTNGNSVYFNFCLKVYSVYFKCFEGFLKKAVVALGKSSLKVIKDNFDGEWKLCVHSICKLEIPR